MTLLYHYGKADFDQLDHCSGQNRDFLSTTEFIPAIAGKSKSKLAPKTQKSRRNAEIPVMVSNQPESVILDTVWGA